MITLAFFSFVIAIVFTCLWWNGANNKELNPDVVCFMGAVMIVLYITSFFAMVNTGI